MKQIVKTHADKQPKISVHNDSNFKVCARGAIWWWTAAVLTVLTLTALPGTTSALNKMHLAYTWGPVSFAFTSDAQRQQLERNGTFIQGNAVPFDVDVDPRTGRVFLAIPWVLSGVCVTLATVENTKQRYAPRLVPYPDWSWHAGARRCEGLTSVFRVHIDRCDRLWVIDSGVAEVATAFRRQCPPQLFVFDLRTNKLLVRHRLAVPEAWQGPLLLSVTVEQMGNTCSDDAYAYVADAGEFALFVFSLRTKSSWYALSYLFYPDVNARTFLVAGTTMYLMDAVMGLAVSAPVNQQCGSYLYFHALSSYQEGRVCTSVLRNSSIQKEGENAAPDAFQFIGRRQSQAADQAITRSGVLFFSPVGQHSINCWNSRRNYSIPNLPMVEQDRNVIRFVTGLKVVASVDNKGPEEVWAISNNAQLLFTGQFKPNANNTINILRSNARNLIAGVNC